MRDPDCLFCKIAAGEIPATLVREDERTVAFMDINPATRGHLLVIPRAHSANLLEIGQEDLAACITAAQQLAALVTDRLEADGVNLINSCGRDAWQTVFHFHLHVIPRYAGDPLRLPWTPEPGDRDAIAAAAAELDAPESGRTSYRQRLRSQPRRDYVCQRRDRSKCGRSSLGAPGSTTGSGEGQGKAWHQGRSSGSLTTRDSAS